MYIQPQISVLVFIKDKQSKYNEETSFDFWKELGIYLKHNLRIPDTLCTTLGRGGGGVGGGGGRGSVPKAIELFNVF